MPAFRPLVTVLAAPALLLLTGCERPAPQVTVFSGPRSDHVEATCWSAEGARTTPEDCQVKADRVGSLTIAPGDTIGISVDQAAAEDGGWVPTIGDARLVPKPLTSTYHRFQLSERDLAAGQLELRIYAVDGEATRGLWVFRLRGR